MSSNTPIPDSLLHRIQQAIERAVEDIPLNPEIAQAEYQTAIMRERLLLTSPSYTPAKGSIRQSRSGVQGIRQ